MFTCKEYRKVETLEEAWKLNQKRSNLLIGGMLWVKMGHRNVQTVIDLSKLGLDTIEETEEEFQIGCMATLRQMEEHEGLNRYSGGAIRESLRHIVGVQFRNVATVGGSVFGRFGFSDVLTMLLAMDSFVELYKGGVIPMHEFVNRGRDRDILVRVIIRKTPGVFAYQSARNARTDFPTLAVAVSSIENTWYISVGARPGRAMLLTVQESGLQELPGERQKDAQKTLSGEPKDTQEAFAAALGEYAAGKIPVGSNMRGSAAYRSQLVKVLVKRACLKIGCNQQTRE